MHPVRLEIVTRFVDIATNALGDAREEIDALNVFPVPDGDTGTNMFLTMSTAREALRQSLRDQGVARIAEDTHVTTPEPVAVSAEHVALALRALGRGALLGARGNSGVILAQMLGAMARHLENAPPGGRAAVLVADALRSASRAAYDAVGDPVEGTILSVAHAASEAAYAAAQVENSRTREVYVAAAAAAREALARTPDQLQALADAGVVDAGGRGLTVILDAAETALTGRRPLSVPTRLGRRSIPVTARPPAPAATSDTPTYEVMFLLDGASAESVETLRTTLNKLGDSLVVIGGEELWNVHVHVDDAGAAIEAAVVAGRPHQIRITHLVDAIHHAEHAGRHAGHACVEAQGEHGAPAGVETDGAEGGRTDDGGPADRSARPDAAGHRGDRGSADPDAVATRRSGRAVVAVSAGPGLAQIFTDAGAVAVMGGPGERPSAGMLLDAVLGTGAAEVVILPNDPDSVRAAEVAARTAEEDDDMQVAVVPSRAQVQGLAALAVHEPGRSFSSDILEMTAAARHCRHGAVTTASKIAITSAGPCQPGDALGVVMGDFAVVGDDLLDTSVEVLTRLLGVGGELVTIVAGENADDLAARLTAWVERTHPGVDVVAYDGGQSRYPLLVSVE